MLDGGQEVQCFVKDISAHGVDFVFNPLHYLALIEQKTNALDQAAPLSASRPSSR